MKSISSMFNNNGMKQKETILRESDLTENDKAIIHRTLVRDKKVTPNSFKNYIASHNHKKNKRLEDERLEIMKAQFNVIDDKIKNVVVKQQMGTMNNRLKSLYGGKKSSKRKIKKRIMTRKRKQRR
jgi:glutamine amidotransferase-like uncharacterized protein